MENFFSATKKLHVMRKLLFFPSRRQKVWESRWLEILMSGLSWAENFEAAVFLIAEFTVLSKRSRSLITMRLMRKLQGVSSKHILYYFYAAYEEATGCLR